MSTVAEQLRKTADSVHESKHENEVLSLYNMLTKKAKEAAAKGSYTVEHYDELLLNTEIVNGLKLKLREDGFKVTIAEDYHYTEHSGTTQMYVRITWE